MPLSASLLNRPFRSPPSYVRSPRIWSHSVPTAANLALENVAQKTINYLPILVVKCTPYHTETVRRLNPKCALSSRHSGQPFTYTYDSGEKVQICQLMTCSIAAAVFDPMPSTSTISSVEAPKHARTVPKRSSNRLARSGPTPGRL